MNFATFNGATFNGSAAGVQFHLLGQVPENIARGVFYSNFADLLTGNEPNAYVLDLVTPGGNVRVPMSSWQATLNVNESNYLQAVIPAALNYAADIAAATEFIVSRVLLLPGLTIEYVMAQSTIDGKPTAQGPNNYTVTVRGYTDGLAEVEDPDEIYDRQLVGIRSINTEGGNYRVRCAIDFVLRPAQRAFIDEVTSFVVDYINFYATNQGGIIFDGYMDVGER